MVKLIKIRDKMLKKRLRNAFRLGLIGVATLPAASSEAQNTLEGLVRDNQIIMFGDNHGTPSFTYNKDNAEFSQLLSRLKEQGIGTVALEIDQQDQGRINGYLAGTLEIRDLPEYIQMFFGNHILPEARRLGLNIKAAEPEEQESGNLREEKISDAIKAEIKDGEKIAVFYGENHLQTPFLAHDLLSPHYGEEIQSLASRLEGDHEVARVNFSDTLDSGFDHTIFPSGLSGRVDYFVLPSGKHKARIIEFDPGEYELRGVIAPDFGKSMISIEELMERSSALGGINGGYYEPNLEPSGLLIQDSKKLHDLTDYGGSGVFILDSDNNPRIVHKSHPISEGDVNLAIQCGPFLVEDNRDMLSGQKLKPSSQMDLPRSSIGITEEGYVILATFESIDLPGLAKVMNYDCSHALNLDGGPSSSMMFGDNDKFRYNASSEVQNHLLIFNK